MASAMPDLPAFCRASPPLAKYQIFCLMTGTCIRTICPRLLLACTRPAIEPATYQSQGHHCNHFTTRSHYKSLTGGLILLFILVFVPCFNNNGSCFDWQQNITFNKNLIRNIPIFGHLVENCGADDCRKWPKSPGRTTSNGMTPSSSTFFMACSSPRSCVPSAAKSPSSSTPSATYLSHCLSKKNARLK